jgi:hypothetical protein
MTIFIMTIFLLFCCQISAEESRKEAISITCCYYDITPSDSSITNEDRLVLIQKHLIDSEASVIVLAGVKDRKMLDIIKKSLPGFNFAEIVITENKTSRIALLSKIKPEKFEALSDIKYNIKKDIELSVQRGFIHAVFNIQGYRFHLFGANLKDRTTHPLYNQTDMRRYEARKIRKIITDTIKSEKEKPANILLLAGLSDTCGKSTVKDVYNRRFGIEKRLFDLRPVDSMNTSWTALDKTRDEYERIDYAIVSSGMIPEIDLDETMIIENYNWNKAAFHRPLIVTINCKEKTAWKDDILTKEFPNTIRSADFKIGQKRKRGSGNPEKEVP